MAKKDRRQKPQQDEEQQHQEEDQHLEEEQLLSNVDQLSSGFKKKLSKQASKRVPSSSPVLPSATFSRHAYGSASELPELAAPAPGLRSKTVSVVDLQARVDLEEGAPTIQEEPTYAAAAPKLVPQDPVVKDMGFWRVAMFIFVVGPWKFIRGLGWLLNKWQRLFRGASGGIYYTLDQVEKLMPTVCAMIIWVWSTWSLLLHFLSVFLTFGVLKILYDRAEVPFCLAITALYCLSHYLMAVIMYMELDRIATLGRYDAHEFLTFCSRLFSVLFFDVQLFASVLHSNSMIEGLTQMLLKGYEEARVCLHLLVNTLPMCGMLGVLYDGVILQWIDVEDIDITSYSQQIWLALIFSVLNALDKIVRVSFKDPWLHPSNDDRYPLLYMRSNAARLPRGLMLDWLFRCNTQLALHEDTLTLREVFSSYIFNCKGDARTLCDGHKAYLLKKALRTFNGSVVFNRAEKIARRLDKSKFRNPRSIVILDASSIHPGRHMSAMLAEVLADSHGYTTLNLGDNMLGDEAVAEIMEGLHSNHVLELDTLLLPGNDIGALGCERLASYLKTAPYLHALDLSRNPIRDAGIKALAEALVSNTSLAKLDLSDASIGPDAGALLGHALKSNKALTELNLSSTQLGGMGAESLAKGLAKNSALRSLVLQRTGIDDRGAVALAAALGSNRTLTELDLSYTRIGDIGAKALCDALQGNSVLRTLDLANTKADKSWIKLIANVITAGKGRR